MGHFLIRLIEAGKPRTIYNYAQRETPSLVSWLRAMARAARMPLDPVAVPSELLQRHTTPPWEDWSYAPFSSTPVLMDLDRAQQVVGLEYRVSLEEWMQTTVDWCLEDGGRLSVTKHGEYRAAEVAIAQSWRRLEADAGQTFTA